MTESPDITPEDLPPALLEHARTFYTEKREPAVPKLASTVLLLREAATRGGVEVHAIRRVSTMPFAAGMYAFPGGTVDPRDADADLRWAGPSPREWAERLGQSESAAQAIVCAAVREVFEESGILLAGSTPSTVVTDVSDEDWEAQRAALVDRRLGFADLLSGRNLVLRADLLAPWSRWVTPEFEPRRYDTYFFLARLPSGQVTRNVGGEADLVTWLHPEDRSTVPMLPPTRITLAEVAGGRTVDELIVMSADRDASTPIIPRLVG